jgi:SAM-dependent methyltransferase
MDATFEGQLRTLLSQPPGQPPEKLFGNIPDELWLWLNTEGYRRSSNLRQLLPGLPEENVQRQWTNRVNDDALVEGFRIYRVVRTLYERHVGSIGDAHGILDFGCGWGRVIRFFLKDLNHRRLTGTDYNSSLVAFCRKSNRWCNFIRNGAEPPLPVEANRFSCVYAYSVFSHFSEPMHLHWLNEFKRILQPGGALAISVRPRHFIEYCRKLRTSETEVEFPILREMFRDTDRELERYDAGEFCYSPYDGSHPDNWWGEACIPRAYIEGEWGRIFDVREFVEAGPQLKQHVVLLTA